MKCLAKTLMLNVLWLFLSTIFLIFRSQAALQVEIVALRHQIGVLRRSAKKRPKLTVADRVFWAWLSAACASRRLAREKLGSPAFGCHARLLGCNRIGGFRGEVPHDLPTDGRVRIEEPFEVRGPGCVIV
jgi:hypothetical protein